LKLIKTIPLLKSTLAAQFVPQSPSMVFSSLESCLLGKQLFVKIGTFENHSKL